MNISFKWTCFMIWTTLLEYSDSAAGSADTIKEIADNIVISAEVLDNLRNNAALHTVRITLHNSGSQPIRSFGWTLYFHSMYHVFPKDLSRSKAKDLEVEKMQIKMLQGDLYSIEPIEGFFAIQPGESRDYDLKVQYWSVGRTDFMPNWYIASNSTQLARLTAFPVKTMSVKFQQSDNLNYVKPFKTIRQWKRTTDDVYNPFTGQARMERLFVRNTDQADNLIIPTPKHITIDDDEISSTMNVDATWTILKISAGTEDAVTELSSLTNLPEQSRNGKNTITLTLSQVGNVSEAYTIEIKPDDDAIELTGRDKVGLYYAVKSLYSILLGYKFKDIPKISVFDEPRFPFRGMHLDVARNFHTEQDVMRLMDAMSMYKLNKLHLHLSDDEGWRLHIPSLPELSMVGGVRCHDLEENECIIPQFGSGPHRNTAGSGFFTQFGYKRLLKYAVAHHIEVIPEFDMPGHAHAAIVAMERRYRDTQNETAANMFRLKDPDDTSVYMSVQQWSDNAVNPCRPSTYDLIGKVLDEVIELHKDIQPLKTYHFGGDEVAKGAWKRSPLCKSFLRNHPQYNGEKGLKKYFIQQVANLTAVRGVALGGWEDGMVDKDGKPFSLDTLDNKNMVANPWDNIWEWGTGQRAYLFANAGYKVIMSQATNLYFDHPYEPDPEERGLYWATRFTDTLKAFRFLPDSLYDNIHERRSGHILKKTDVCGEDMSKCPELNKKENIIGIQGHLWSETVRNSAQMDYMIFPRLLALAERAWHKADFEETNITEIEREKRIEQDWEAFANTLGHKELLRLDEMGVKYRVPPPYASVVDNAWAKLNTKEEVDQTRVKRSRSRSSRTRSSRSRSSRISSSRSRSSRISSSRSRSPVSRSSRRRPSLTRNIKIISSRRRKFRRPSHQRKLRPYLPWGRKIWRRRRYDVRKRYMVPSVNGDRYGVYVSTAFPGLQIQYKTKDGIWKTIPEGFNNWKNMDRKLTMRTRSANGLRSSREVVIDVDEGTHDTIPIQRTIDYIADNLEVKVKTIDNIYKYMGKYVKMGLLLSNKGIKNIEGGEWKLYFYSLYGARHQNLSCGLTVHHENGGLYYFTPSDVRKGKTIIEAGKTLWCTYYNRRWLVSRTDHMPNWYVSSTGMKAKVIKNTAGEDLSFVETFNEPRQWKRSMDDRYNPYTAEQRYGMYRMNDTGPKKTSVVPTPMDVSLDETSTLMFSNKDGWVVVASTFEFGPTYLADKLNVKLKNDGISKLPKDKYIIFTKVNNGGQGPEAYTLDIDPSKQIITISAEYPTGALHGVQTLISLIDTSGGMLASMTIKDKPRFSYRGVMLDVARNFKPVEWILQFLDLMSMYKLNKLHLHLSDDESWRLEIPDIPELIEVASNRKQSDFTDSCVIPQLGSGPDTNSTGSGYYTVKDYQDILQHAHERSITVIPEIDMPGHSAAAISAMAYRDTKIRKLKSHKSRNLPESYLLHDDGDVTGEHSVQGWETNSINPCQPSSYKFVEKVVEGLQDLHKDIMPLEIFHLGGDEVPEGVWTESASCQNDPDKKNMSTTSLQRMFVKEVAAILTNRNLSIATWEDGVYTDNKPNPRSDFKTREVYVYPWNNRWETGKAKRSSEFADEGYKVILPLATHLYLDQQYEPDPEERGLYWASRNTDTRKVFGLMPDNIYANADVTRMGRPVDLNSICKNKACPMTTKAENILGLQACFWSETIRTEAELNYMAFPRLLGLAERAWHKASWEDISDVDQRNRALAKDWEAFANTLGYNELPRLDQLEVKYRIPPPGAKFNGSSLQVNTQFPNLNVELSKDGGKTWSVVDRNVTLKTFGTYHLRSRSTNRTSRVITLTHEKKKKKKEKKKTKPASAAIIIHISPLVVAMTAFFTILLL